VNFKIVETTHHGAIETSAKNEHQDASDWILSEIGDSISKDHLFLVKTGSSLLGNPGGSTAHLRFVLNQPSEIGMQTRKSTL